MKIRERNAVVSTDSDLENDQKKFSKIATRQNILKNKNREMKENIVPNEKIVPIKKCAIEAKAIVVKSN